MIYSALERINEIGIKASQGYVKGYQMPFKCLDDLYSMKLGCTTYIVGHEYSGKTEFIMERDIWMAKQFNLSTLIFTPETGDVDDIFMELGHKWCGKPLIGKYKISDAERMSVLTEIQQFFHVVEVDTTDKSITLEMLLEKCLQYENSTGIKINSIVIDPFNELDVNYNGLPRDEWLQKELGRVRRMARNHKKHITIITHPRDTERLYDNKTNCLLPPSRKDYAGGQAWARKGECMLCVYRPPVVLNNETECYKENECHIIVQKSKPKGVGNTGTAVLFFDWKRSAYYEEIDGKRYYAGEWYNSQLQDPTKPSFDFTELDKLNR